MSGIKCSRRLGNGIVSSIGKRVSVKSAGVPPWNEQLAEFGTRLLRELPYHAEEVAGGLVLLLAFSILAASL
jgi:hypothetical protein